MSRAAEEGEPLVRCLQWPGGGSVCNGDEARDEDHQERPCRHKRQGGTIQNGKLPLLLISFSWGAASRGAVQREGSPNRQNGLRAFQEGAA